MGDNCRPTSFSHDAAHQRHSSGNSELQSPCGRIARHAYRPNGERITINEAAKHVIRSVQHRKAALVIVDPQNDLCSPDGAMWDIVGDGVRERRVVEHLVELRDAARMAEIPIVYSPHEICRIDHREWRRVNLFDRVLHERRIFDSESSGADWLPELEPDADTIICSPHKNLSGFWTSDIATQLRRRDVQTIVLAGMVANLCVESHLRDAIECGFDVVVVRDATSGTSEEATAASLATFDLLATEVVTTAYLVEVLGQLREQSIAAPQAGITQHNQQEEWSRNG
jgi:nicotinamidase-related amidase